MYCPQLTVPGSGAVLGPRGSRRARRAARLEHVEVPGSRRARSNVKQLPGTRRCEAALYALLYPHWDQLQINRKDRAILSGLLGYASFLKT